MEAKTEATKTEEVFDTIGLAQKVYDTAEKLTKLNGRHRMKVDGEKFEEVVEAGTGPNPGGSVSKMLANGTPSKSEPGGIRTRDALIKSQVLFL